MGIFKKRSIKSLGKKKSDMPEGLWNKCPSCGAIIDEITLKQRHRVCTKCDHHFTLTSQERVEMMLDPDSFEELDAGLESVNTLGFKGYTDKVRLLRVWPAANVHVVSIGKFVDIDHGPVALSTGSIDDFDLIAKEPGFVLHFSALRSPVWRGTPWSASQRSASRTVTNSG